MMYELPGLDAWLESQQRFEQPAGHNKFGFVFCPFCQATPTYFEFRDALSAREYEISGLCQECQDKVFVEPQEDSWTLDDNEPAF